MEHGGYSFIISRSVPEKDTVYYICKRYKQPCHARLIEKGGMVKQRNDHTCKEDALPSMVMDARAEMREELRRLALVEAQAAPSTLWTQVARTLRKKYGDEKGVKLISMKPGMSIIKNTRAQAYGAEAMRALDDKNVNCVGEKDPRPIVQFNLLIASPKAGGKDRRLIGFAHPDLARLLRYPNVPLFVDGTFKVVPAGFSQCLIFMAYDPSYDLYIPVFYVLVDNKEKDTYWTVLNMIIIQSDRRLNPATVTCDFELALIGAITDQSPKAHIVGCLFHWKQALRRKLLDCHLTKDEVKDVMEPGKMDVLTVIPPDEIEDKGIRFVRSLVDETGAEKKWDQFWGYFKATWMKRYRPSQWNVNEMDSNDVEIINRTNNPLEKYNRDFADQFPSTHPSLLTFVNVVKQEGARYVAMMDDISHSRRDPPAHAEPVRVKIPRGYATFK